MTSCRAAERVAVSAMRNWCCAVGGGRRSVVRAGLFSCFLVVSGVGAAPAQPPEPAGRAPAVNIPELPEQLRRLAGPPEGRAPAAGQTPENPSSPAAAPADPAAPDLSGAVSGAADGDRGAGEPVADPARPPASDGTPPPAPVPEEDAAPAMPAVVGMESDLTLAARAAALLGRDLDPAAERTRVQIGAGAADPAQSLSRAVFAAPVAGSIPYVVQAQIHHDVTLIFPREWSLVQVFVGDPRRWAVTHAGSVVVLKPGEAGARTNLTAVLASGEVLQMDLEEVTGLAGARRTGRVYVGPEPWLVDRIFSMLPEQVRARVADSPATVAQLLADPVGVVGRYGGTGAVPSPPSEAAAGSAASPAPSEPVPDSGAVPPVAGARPSMRAPSSPAAAAAPEPGTYVSAVEVSALDTRLRRATARAKSARRAAGDRIAAAQLALEADLEALREEYPLRTQFSYVLDPPLPPYTEPLWHFGVWHDGERTFWRLLAPEPSFEDAASGAPLEPEMLDDYLYRFDRVIEHGAVVVRLPNDPRPRPLYFRRRRELEGP